MEEVTLDTRSEVRSFIESNFPGAEVADEDDIFALGFVNSLFAMQLVMFIEKRFGFTIPNEELDFDNFRTIDAISRLVARHLPGAHV